MLCKLTSCWLRCAHACSLAPRTSRPPVWKTTLKNITGKLDPTCCYWRTVFTLLRFSTSGQMADCCCVFLLPFFLLSKKSVVLHETVPRKSFSPACTFVVTAVESKTEQQHVTNVYLLTRQRRHCWPFSQEYIHSHFPKPSINPSIVSWLSHREGGVTPWAIGHFITGPHTERQVTKLMPLLFWAKNPECLDRTTHSWSGNW